MRTVSGEIILAANITAWVIELPGIEFHATLLADNALLITGVCISEGLSLGINIDGGLGLN